MFSLVLIANFTGYLLPYDQLAFWAVTVSTGMLEYIPGIGFRLQEMIRGGTEIGPASLRIFFSLHTFVIPSGLIILMAFHFWRIRKVRGLVLPRAPEDEMATASDEEKYLQAAWFALKEDMAEVIVLGCAGMAGLDRHLEEKLGVPVLDGVVCALIIATGLVR